VWLAENGTGHGEIATRLGIAPSTVEDYLRHPDGPPGPSERDECAVVGCANTAAHYRWCDEHRVPRDVYNVFRAAGHGRNKAARLTGVAVGSTYRWEPGQPGAGRPRKETQEV
jgi:hypothetical protein